MIKPVAQVSTLLGLMDSLADPTRLRLLRLIERHELGVVELCDVLQLPQSTVSRHLKVLADQGWTRSRREGTTNYYHTVLDELDPAARKLWLLAREQTRDWATLRQDQLRLAQRLKQRQRDSQAFFAGAAGQWDRLRTELYGDHFTHAALAALVPAEWVIADLGCGTGVVTVELAPNVKHVIGIDQSAAMLKAARRRAADCDNVDLRRGDLEAIPIDDETCDAALLLIALSYVADPAVVLRETSRILRPGGKLVVVDLLSHDQDDFRRRMGQQSMGFDAEQMQRLLADARFDNITCRHLPPQPNAKGPALMLTEAKRPETNGKKR